VPRKHNIKPKLKVGDWVRLNPESIRHHFYRNISTGIHQITDMIYHEKYEHNPSPWEIKFAVRLSNECFEEDVILDPFMTAAHRAVENDDAA